MPEMDGYEASRIIDAMKSDNEIGDVPIIALTANAMKGDKEKCLEAGMNDYLSKPVRKKTLMKTIEKWVSDDAPGKDEQAPLNAVGEVTGLKSAVLDMEAIEDARDSMKDKFATMVGYYLEDSTDCVSQIDDAVSSGTFSKLVAPAHMLKSSSRLLGAMDVADLAMQMEEKSRLLGEDGQGDVDFAALAGALGVALKAAHIELEDVIKADAA